MLSWFTIQREKGLIVTTEDIRMKALNLFPELYNRPVGKSTFIASNGWIRNWLMRNKLKSRVATSVGQKIPEKARNISLNFFERIDKFRNGRKDFIIMNMDEMPIYFDSIVANL